MIQNIEFAYPWVFAFLLTIPLLMWLYFKGTFTKTATLQVSTLEFIDKRKNLTSYLFHLPFLLRCVALVFLLIALARPQQNNSKTILEGKGIDIMLCLDVSASMNYQDFVPNRLDASKRIAIDFVKKRTGDNMGIAIFSNQAFTLCPLTTDTGSIIRQISSINKNVLDQEGTAIGTGIAVCINRLKNSKSKSKIIILETDGVNSIENLIQPRTAADLANESRIKIYAIGIGSQKEMQIKIKTPYGEIDQLKKLEYNEQLLKDIAKATGGHYFYTTDNKGMRNAYESINQLEKSTIKTVLFNKVKDKFEVWIAVGFILIFIEICLRYTVFRIFP